MNKPGLHSADRKLDSISRKLSLSWLKPVNEESEKRKFFAQPGYNPRFEYPTIKKGIDVQERALSKVECDDSTVGLLLAGIRDRYLLDIEMQKARGTQHFTEVSMQLHGSPDKKLVRTAKKLMQLKVNPERIEYSTGQIIRKLRIAFVKYGFHWDIEQKNMVANAAVRTEARQLLVRKNSRFSRNFLKRIIVHEIGTHIMRAENGWQQPYLFFSRGLPGYLMTEEGLAVYNEEVNSCLNNYVLKIYAGRVLAVNAALECSFYDTYHLLRRYFTKNTSWRLAVRAKRGLTDTSLAGAYTKDIAYLKGYLAVKNYIESGGDVYKLYYGKVGVEHVRLLEDIKGLKDPRILPMYRYIDYIRVHFSGFVNNFVLLDKIEEFSLDSLKTDQAGGV